jgi:formyltetrahydrofolate deformylase
LPESSPAQDRSLKVAGRSGKRVESNAQQRSAILLIVCPDQKGLVACVSDFVYRHDGNILHAEQHVDAQQGVFFHRVEWDINGFALAWTDIGAAFAPLAARFGMSWDLRFSWHRPRIAIFVSKYDHCLLDLLHRHKVSELPGEIAAIVSNHPDLGPVVSPFGVPFHVFPMSPEAKEKQEEREIGLLRDLGVELIVLARYMQILTPRIIDRYPNRIINIHHSFLPAFAGKKPYHQAHERGVKLIGATSHYVTEELDQGPIIEQDVCRISHRESVEDIILKGRDLERRVLARAVRLHLLNRILTYGMKTVVFD